MPFFYPNWSNDFWRVMGLIFHTDKDWFAIQGEKRFDRQKVEYFCREQGIALYDTARAVRRLQDNASDKYLEVVTPTDIPALLTKIPACQRLITTGQKATDVMVETFGCAEPPMGGHVSVVVPEVSGIVPPGQLLASRTLLFYRMPSTSRAYPLPLEKKAAYYRRLFE